MIWILSLIIFDRSLTGKNPPEEMSVRAKFKESKDLIEKIFKTTKIIRVRPEYKRKIFVACFNISELLNGELIEKADKVLSSLDKFDITMKSAVQKEKEKASAMVTLSLK